MIASFPRMGKSSRNPYLRLIKKELDAVGIDIDDSNPDTLEFSWLLRNRARVSVLHLNWLQYHYINIATMKLSIFRYIKFLMLLNLAKRMGYKIVWTVHNIFSHENIAPSADRYLRQVLFGLCDAIFTHSFYAKKVISDEFHVVSPIHVIKHPNYIGVYRNSISKKAAREKLGIDMGRLVYACIGEVRRYKGVDKLIETFRRVENPDLTLLIAGHPLTSSMENELRMLAAPDERIKLDLHNVDDDDLQVYMNASDFLVFPFSGINVSGSLILAMSFGKTAIFPDMGGLTEYAGPDMAIIYDKHEPDSLYRALLRAMESPAEEMGHRAHHAVACHTWKNMADQLVGVYTEVTG